MIWQPVPAKSSFLPSDRYFFILWKQSPISDCTYLEPRKAGRSALSVQKSCTKCRGEAKRAAHTTPPSSKMLSAKRLNTPPEEDCFLRTSSLNFAAKTVSGGLCGECFARTGHTFSHNPQLLQFSASATGWRNPSLLSFIEMQCLGQMAKQALQPQHLASDTLFITDISSVFEYFRKHSPE